MEPSKKPPDIATTLRRSGIPRDTLKSAPDTSITERAATVASTPFLQVDPGSIDPASHAHDEREGPLTRYKPGELLGEGGMGEVRLYEDTRIGRAVALKAIRPGHGSRSDLRLRFVREARVQGQLEHPSVVPVYDLSLRPEPAFFTMKRVRGVTLEQVIDKLRGGDAETAGRFSRRKLLTAFGQVCLAVDYAHAHGVVHRDLKPANVMLGDFGEVYVLDWGVAKVGEGADLAAGEPLDAAAAPDAKTAAGALMGTLGYMAPEQMRGEAVDGRADVYALGAVLFEVLSLVPLHKGDKTSDLVQSTLLGADARASKRTPDRDVPPELEAVCVRATATDPAERYASTRELSDAVEGFLDGDRDMALRRAMAQDLARSAAAATERALSAEPANAAKERAQALHAIGHTLALDPTNAEALHAALRLRTQPPRELPDEAKAKLTEARSRTLREAAYGGSVGYLSAILYLPLLVWMGVRDWALIGAIFAFIALASTIAYRATRGPSARHLIVAILSSSLAFALLSRLLGPFVLVPALVVVNSAAFSIDPTRITRLTSLGAGVLAIAAPFALERLGILDPSYAFGDDMVAILPHAAHLPEVPTLAFLLIATIGTVVTGSLYMDRVRRALERAEQRIHLQAWQLAQLVPDTAHGATEVELAPQGCLLTSR